MNLNQLAVFVRVVDQGSFTKAAKALKQPKSRVSRTISALEEKVGVPLLYRSTRQLSLTEAGNALYLKSKEHVYGLELASEEMKETPNEVSGVIRLTCAEDFGSMVLGPFVSELTKRFPKLRVELHLSNEVVDLVKDGMDIAIRIGTLEDTSLKAKKIGGFAWIFVASPSYLKSAPRIHSLKDLSQHPTLLFSFEKDEDTWTLLKDGKLHKFKSTPLCQANNPKTLLDIALAGRGVALVPEFLCLELLEQKKLVRVLPEFTTKPDPVHFVWPSQKGANLKLRAFLDFGSEYFQRFLA